MTKFWINLVLVKVLFPSLLVLGVIWRPVGLSLVYLLLALVAPFVPVPTHYSTSGPTAKPGQHFLVAGMSLSCLIGLVQLIFQILVLVPPFKKEFPENCKFLEELLRHVGLVRLKSATLQEFIIWLAPEVVIFPSSIIIYCISRRLAGTAPPSDDGESSLQSLQRYEKKSKDRSEKMINVLGGLGTYIVLATLCFTASLNPSVEGGLYFLVFVLSATWWATHRELHRGFAIVCRLLMFVVGLHVTMLLSYQNQWPQEHLPMKGPWARYFALNATFETNCTDPRERHYIEDNIVPVYSYQLRLFLLYFVLGLQSSFLFAKPKPTFVPQSPQPNERSPLMRFGSGRSGGLLQDSTGSVIVQDGQQDDIIQMQSLSEGAPEEQPGIVENIIMALFSIYQLIAHSSYLGTNIIMMTWSIMYHSWSTFVLLLWALILWMVPNKRSSMMKCSKFIVFYSTVLILIQYVYSLDLTEKELPNIIFGINMVEVGFNESPSQSSHWHLITKCCFLTMFWITMRQYSAEVVRQRRSSTLRDMVAPLHVSVSTAMNNNNNSGSQAEPEIKSKYIQEVGRLVKKFLVKFWIVAVALMLFISGFFGERMTVFRIVYMTLFLLFIVTFQISWVAWKKMLYGFLVTVIGYSIIMLILVYTYQFPEFPKYLDQYLNIPIDLQHDIGLITYDTKDLFVKLITPTSCVIISVIQIHYFHDVYLELTNLNKVSDVSRKDSLGHSPSEIPIISPDEVFVTQNDDLSHAFTLKELKEISKLEMTVLWGKISGHIWNFYNYTWLFIELHIQKIIFISFVIFCINDICAINVFFIVTVAISINFRRGSQIMVINTMASIIAILVVVKMLYQIDYIKHENWNRNCTLSQIEDTETHSNQTTTYNMAEWIGLKKIDKDNTLTNLLEGSILLLAVTTFRAMIMVRQLFHRQQKGEPLETPMFMFPEIKRADADKGLVACFKFLCNYGFYKFGLEFCLIGMVGLIGIRLDFYSVLYSIWLMILFSMNRKATSTVWPFLKMFAVVMLPLQYAMIVAPPPWLCIAYPWPQEVWLRSLQKWMALPDPDNRPNPKKLICDLILLMMIVRQSLVFRTEERSVASGQEFVAGHNYSVFKEMEKPNSVNPVKDYVSHIHNWLDVLKRGCFMSLMWITLAFMFLAGTKRTNLFSLGYLIGAFVFLWQGTDFYLRPVNTILKWWNILIGYNILVIFGKTIFQGIGCMYTPKPEACKSFCWLIQLLGMACLDKFEDQIKVGCECDVHREDIGMLWDGLCFAFLLLQKRLFRSYYFFYIVDETKAMSILASRGAELLEKLHQKRITEQENLERAMLQKIKFKMDKIKANQRKLQGPGYREAKTHMIDNLYKPFERPVYMRREPKTHVEAVRSGDYYMFDDMDDDDLTDFFSEDKNILEEEEKEEESRRRKADKRGRRMTVSELPEQETHMTDSTGDDATDHELDDFDKMSEESGKDKKKKEKNEEGEKVSFLTYFKFVWAFLNSSMVSMTRRLNRYSNDYRYIRKVLAKEKKLLKAKPDFRMGTRLGINQIWQPIVKPRSPREENPDEITEAPVEGPSNKENLDNRSSLIAQGIHTQHENDEDAVLSEVDQPPVIQLAASVWFGVLSHSTFLCYFMVFMHQIHNASLLSTPLPLMVFLWGSLTIPRPSKTFWITLIAYVEVIVVIKFICQPFFNHWNIDDVKFLGIKRETNYALWELMLLLVIFFHRYMLKSLGQWTMPSIKSRKVIPTGLTIATVRQPRQNGDTNNEVDENGIADNKVVTPKGRILTLHLDGEGDRLTDPPPTGDNERLVVIQATETDVIQEDFQKAVKLTTIKYWEPIKRFFEDIRDPNGKEKTNVYVYMFLCDFFNFLLLIFGFSAFGTRQDDGGVAAYVMENRIPIPFLVMLLSQFALIVIDRAFYLKKSVTNRLILHYPFVIVVHIAMFFILPSLTDKPFNTNTVLQIWYIVKCFYLLLAAYQLRLGYPTRVLGNFLCEKFTLLHYMLFKVFMNIPLLFEMRAVMDWIWTDTSMTLMDWFKMEDIFANIYQIKCSRWMESEYPQERGVKKKQMSKYLVGGGFLIFMIGIIWFPLMIFALGNTVGRSNLPKEVTLEMRIGSYEPIYTIVAENSSILRYSEENFNDLKNLYRKQLRDQAATTFLTDYEHTDVVAVKLSPSSGRLWSITPPDRQRLKDELLSSNIMTIHVEWSVTREPISKEASGTTSQVHNIDVPPFLDDGSLNPVRQGLLNALNGLSENNQMAESKSVLLENALPMFLKVTSRGISEVAQLMRPLVQSSAAEKHLYRNVKLVVMNNTLSQQWFFVNETCDDSSFNATKIKVPLNDCSYIMMFLFNDKSFPEGLSFFTSAGIIGMYTTFVILVSGIVKRMVTEIAPKIMFEDLPYVDRILRLCLDIYLVRESGDLCLEEDLFAKLVFLYRSPETLIRWTRPPESDELRDGNEDDQNYNEIDNYGADVDDDGDDDNEEEERLQLRRRRQD